MIKMRMPIRARLRAVTTGMKRPMIRVRREKLVKSLKKKVRVVKMVMQRKVTMRKKQLTRMLMLRERMTMMRNPREIQNHAARRKHS